MRNLTMLTDLYQLTMMNGYFKNNMHKKVCVFDIFFRHNGIITYSVAAGLEQAAQYLTSINFSDEDIKYLSNLKIFQSDFLEYLKGFKFTGDFYSVAEGTVVFPGEPIATIKATAIEAQLVETALLNIINHQTLIATKASKVTFAASGGKVMEFGLRRAQGPDAGLYGARAAVIGGCTSTSNVLAGEKFGVPVSGTQSHSWVMNFESELEAFRAYAKIYPDSCLLLVDTYDTLRQGMPNAIKVFDELKEKGYKPVGIRLDSGDLAYLSKKAREMLDDAGHTGAIICASGDLDEHAITSLKNQGAKIDLWGVGTRLITSSDMPSLGGVYKLAAVYENGREVPKIKVSDNAEKITTPCFKDIVRIYDRESGKAEADLIVLKDEEIDESKPLTIFHPIETWKKTTYTNYFTKKLHKKIIDGGELVYKLPKLDEIRRYAKAETDSFWEEYKRLDKPHIYKVDLSQRLYDIKNNLLKQMRGE